MGEGPKAIQVTCPECGAPAYAIVPQQAAIIEGEERSDGKVRANCYECDDFFLVYYEIE